VGGGGGGGGGEVGFLEWTMSWVKNHKIFSNFNKNS